MIIDTHCHIHGRQYNEDFDQVLANASAAGVEEIVMIGVNPVDSAEAIRRAVDHPGRLYVVAGLHPHEANEWSEEMARELKRLVKENPSLVVGIGEMGLDYYYDYAPKEQQFDAFRGQLQLAHDLSKAAVIHCRDAYEDCLVVLQEFYEHQGQGSLEHPRGVLHCYFGNLQQAVAARELGFMIGVGGSCTFKNARELHEVIAETPLEQIVLETDAPYMAPIPYRGKRNEPAYLSEVVARVAHLKGTSDEEVVQATSSNAKRLYGLL